VVYVAGEHYRVYIESMIIPIWVADKNANRFLLAIDQAAAADHRTRSAWVRLKLEEALRDTDDSGIGSVGGVSSHAAGVATVCPDSGTHTAVNPTPEGYVRHNAG